MAHLQASRGLRALFVALVALACAPAPALAAPQLQDRLAKALAVPHVSRQQTAAVAVDLRTGKRIFSLNEQRALLPASTEKLAVAYTALRELGAAYRIPTEVLGEGELDGATWRGNLVLKGFGDPTLSRAQLRRLAQGVRAFGVVRVTGAIVGDESYFDARRTVDGWKPRYLIRESPPLSALVVDRGRYGGRTSTNPALAAAILFHRELRSAGVTVGGPARLGAPKAGGLPLALVESPKLIAVVRHMGVESDNFTAEMLLKLLGAEVAGRGTSAAGAAVVMAALRLEGVPTGGVRVVDGSGLSWLNRLTAQSLVALLQVAWSDPYVRPGFLRALPVAGVSGTLKKRLRAPAVRGRVHAKTGTTSGASALAGYVNGRYAFAILQNGRPVATRWARAAQDRFVLVLARAE